MPVVACLLAACGGGKPVTSAPQPAPVVRDTTPSPVPTPAPAPAPVPRPVAPFGEFASRPVVVFPVQRYAVGDSGWLMASSATGRPRAALVDSALASALRDRGLEPTWSLPANTARVAAREVMRQTDPRALSTAGLAPSRRPNDLDLREPLSSQLRSIIALIPEARYILLPVEARVRLLPDGTRQATIRLAFLDGRMATVLSFPDVTGTPAATDAAALGAAATKFGDLIITP